MSLPDICIGILCTLLCICPAHSQYVNCNRTFRGSDYSGRDSDIITISMDNIAPTDVGKPIICWLNFIGTDSQRVLVRVLSVRAGPYNPGVGCTYGQLKISDGSGDWSDENFYPTTLCGYYEREGSKKINLKRYSSQNSAKVDFWVTKAASTTGYELEVQFLDTDNGGGLRGDFGNYHKDIGRVPDTKCDWVIPVGRYCDIRECTIVTPGYPGIYPPNTQCFYYLTNGQGARVKLTLDSTKGGKFDLKRSTRCTDDYVNVYDGNSTSAPLIGTYCAHDGGVFISSQDSLLLAFHSGAGGPPWDYSGFEGHISTRFSSQPTGGIVTASNVCDYTITEDNTTASSGTMNSPDHSLIAGTVCIYKFISYPKHHVVLDMAFTGMSEKCSDFIEVTENDVVVEKVCSDKLVAGERKEIRYESYGPNITVRYVHDKGQISKVNPVFIDYTFKPGTRYFPFTNPPTLYQNLQPTGDTNGISKMSGSLLLILPLLLAVFAARNS